MAPLFPARGVLRLLPVSGAAFLVAAVASAQDGGGVLLTFGIDQRLSWIGNPELDIPATDSRLRSDTRLTFGMVSETARDRLALNLSTLLRGEDAGDDLDFGLETSSANLSYTRSGFSSSFTASAFLRETNLDEGLSLIEGPEGEPPLLVFQEGSARTQGARLRYSWGEGGPWGGTLRAGLTDTAYYDTTDSALVDNQTLSFGGGLRLALNDVTEATLDIDHRRFDETGPSPSEDSTTVSAGITRALPRGSLSAKVSATKDDDETRTALSFGHSYDLPRGTLSFDLGLTRIGGGDTDMTGTLAWRQDLARGALSLRLSRAVTFDTDNDETLVTTFTLALSQELGPRTGLSIGANWARSEEPGGGGATDSASLEASLSYAVTEDWAMNFGASHKLQDEDGVGQAESSSVFLSIGRTFQWRP